MIVKLLDVLLKLLSRGFYILVTWNLCGFIVCLLDWLKRYYSILYFLNYSSTYFPVPCIFFSFILVLFINFSAGLRIGKYEGILIAFNLDFVINYNVFELVCTFALSKTITKSESLGSSWPSLANHNSLMYNIISSEVIEPSDPISP